MITVVPCSLVNSFSAVLGRGLAVFWVALLRVGAVMRMLDGVV
jgi:hypothetical protein